MAHRSSPAAAPSSNRSAYSDSTETSRKASGMRLRSTAIVVSLPLVSVGCSGIGDYFNEPDIRLDQAVVRGAGLSGGDLDLVVSIENPNNFTLQGTKLQVGVDVEGSHLGDVTYDDDYAVPERGQTTVTLSLRFVWSGVGNAIRAALERGDLPYKMKGVATLRLPGGFTKAVSFTHEGRAPLRALSGSIAAPGVGQ